MAKRSSTVDYLDPDLSEDLDLVVDHDHGEIRLSFSFATDTLIISAETATRLAQILNTAVLAEARDTGELH